MGLPETKPQSEASLEQVLQWEQYYDYSVRHFQEKLCEVHGIHYGYTWVTTALQEAGLVERRKKWSSHRKRRPRRPLPGMMLHIDGSEHRWFSDDRNVELLVVIDDATSETYYAQFVGAEDTRSLRDGAASTAPVPALGRRSSCVPALLYPPPQAWSELADLDLAVQHRTNHLLMKPDILTC